ncbi:hypothetical protein [Sutcliffiella cohnii]|uniref:hypothetical protein n=1 Tax=Sutcliffiella cohnii TaxID=33932 RepID=UPI002E1BA0FF|nr:hypothetical protein [Sutcliffiella cohnii]
MKKTIMEYDTTIVKKGFYFEFELIARALGCKLKEVVFLGHTPSGNVYSTPKENYIVVSQLSDYNFETGRGSFKYRKYKGATEKLNKRNVEQFHKEQNEFIELLQKEGNQLKVPDSIEVYKTLPEAIAGYCKVVSNAFGCNEEQHKQILDLKQQLHEWIEREGYKR